jgi:hypothetical protein
VTEPIIPEFVACGVCGKPTPTADDPNFTFCAECQWRYPASLLKATVDQFDYACRLRTGEVIRFEQATIQGDFVTLHETRSVGTDDPEDLPYPFPRGLDVRIADIVWCADAPEGS